MNDENARSEVREPPKLRSALSQRGNRSSHYSIVKNAVDSPTLKRLRGDGSVEAFPRERYFAFSKHMKILSKDEGLVPFVRLGTQMYLVDEIEKGVAAGCTTFVILKNRQSGVSTELLCLDMFWAFEYSGLLGVFATHEEASRDLFRNTIDLFLETLPRGYKVPQNKNNAKMLVLKNMSLFRYLVAGQRSQSNKLGRSGGCNYLHATEVAFWGSADDLSSLNQTLSEKYRHRMYMFESTANGFNHFETMWQVALASPAQRAIFIGWWRDERNEFAETHPLYDVYMPQGVATPLDEREQEGVRAVWEQYQFRITAGQIAWYRYHKETKCNGDQQTMDQEQPWVPEDAFQSTGSVFFNNRALSSQMKRAARQNRMWAYRVVAPERFTEMVLQPLAQIQMRSADLRIWEMPSRQGRYVMGVDPAAGTGNDEGVISIWRVYADVAFQVAEYASNEISTHRLAWVIGYLGGLYHADMVHIEITGPGMSVLQELDRLKQDTHLMVGPDGESIFNVLSRMRDFLYRRPDSVGGGVMKHWKQSLDLKRLLMDRFKNYVELDQAQVRSLTCLEQMRKIVISETENVEASGAYHDDKPVAAALAIYAWAEWLVPKLRAQQFTLVRATQIEKNGGEDPMNTLLRRFMQEKKIVVRDDMEA